ncbi:hypothetical protein VP01_117g5 [Puccinia sorghi]|uniref:Uncharacterized protein n=1 Tax=Puccinia sorghi TaxID=27349 RepID=A0A0L6VRA5_9BASI|nr:hypothetical protein VP01_117g5 [Puccinia sorghi]
MHQAPVKLLVILRAPSPLDLDMCILMRPVQTSEASSHNQTVQAKGSCPFHPKPQWATHLQALIETCNNSFPLLYTQQTSTAKSNELSLASEIGSTSGSSTRQIASQSKSIKSVPPDDRLPYAKTSSTSAPEKKYQPSFLMHTIRQHIKHCLSTSKTKHKMYVNRITSNTSLPWSLMPSNEPLLDHDIILLKPLLIRIHIIWQFYHLEVFAALWFSTAGSLIRGNSQSMRILTHPSKSVDASSRLTSRSRSSQANSITFNLTGNPTWRLATRIFITLPLLTLCRKSAQLILRSSTPPLANLLPNWKKLGGMQLQGLLESWSGGMQKGFLGPLNQRTKMMEMIFASMPLRWSILVWLVLPWSKVHQLLNGSDWDPICLCKWRAGEHPSDQQQGPSSR